MIALLWIPVGPGTAADLNPDLSITTPRGAYVAVLFWSFMAVLTLACTIPQRMDSPRS